MNEYFIRHGESQANQEGTYQGQSYDTDLSPLGREQAVAVAKALEGINLQKIITSPLKRTRQTAMYIAGKTNTPLTTDVRLLEINHGTWEGKRPTEFNEAEQEILTQWQKEPHLTQMPNGENFNDVVKRTQGFLLELEKSGETAAIVTHDLILRVIAATVFNLDFSQIWNFRLDNCGLSVISFNPRQVIELNNRAHLGLNTSLIDRQAL